MSAKPNAYLVQLRDQIAKTFDLDELRALTFDLQLDWDELEGSRKTTRVQDLITQLAQNGKLEDLVELLKKYRPRATWPPAPAPEQQKHDIRTAFPQKPFYQQPWPRAIAIALLAVIGIFIAIWSIRNRIEQLPSASDIVDAFPTPTTIPTSMPTPLPFEPEAENETLIVISTFYHTEGVVDVIPHVEIRDAIEEKLRELDINNVRVEIEPTTIDGTKRDDEKREEAEALGTLHNASIIIWGVNTGIKVEVNFLLLKNVEFDASDILISEVKTTQLTQREAYGQFILDDLPRQLTFLSLYAIGQSYQVTENYQQAIELIKSAIASITELPDIDYSLFKLDSAYFRLGNLYDNTEQYTLAIEAFDQTVNLNPSYVAALNNRGNVYTDLGQYIQAIDDFDQAISLYPSVAEFFNNRGIAYFYLDDFTKAIADFNQAITVNPDDAVSFNNRGSVYLFLGELASAIDDFDHAIALDPGYASAYANRGNAFADLGNYEQAIIDLEKALTLDPKDGITLYHRGNVSRDLGDYEQAITYYSQAISLNQGFNQMYNNRGLVYSALGQYAKAIVDFNEAITLKPEDAAAYINLGTTYDNLHEYEQAITNYDKAIALNPSSAEAFNNRGGTYNSLGEYEQAIVNFDQAISINKEFAPAFMNRGLAYSNLGNYEQGIINYNQAISLNSEFAEAFFNRANAYSDLRYDEQALDDYARAIIINPRYADAYTNRAAVFIVQGKYEEALSDLNQAIEISPSNSIAFNSRGAIYFNLGDLENAISDFNIAISLNPDFAEAFNNRGLTYHNLDKYDEALADFQTFVSINPQVVVASTWNYICWYGNLLGFAEDVAYSCDNAVSLAGDSQEKISYLDSRGINKALRNDFEGAIADFQTFVDFFDSLPGYENYVAMRISWIRSLNANENPFDAETLEELLNE